MSTWRSKALSFFPEIRQEIATAESLGTFWIELMSRYRVEAEAAERADFRHNVYMYAAWCDASPDWKTREAAEIEFFQSIVLIARHAGRASYETVVGELVAFFG